MIRSLLILLSVMVSGGLFSQNVAQWRGENRDGIYNETGLLKKWPDGGPKLLWYFDELGEGHASAVVTDEMVYSAGTYDGQGLVFAFDHTGQLKWKTEYGREWIENYDGVRSTPMVCDGKLYIMSGYGEVVCMNAKSGQILWSVDVQKEYDGRNIQWGYTENLVVDGNKLFCVPGGTEANVIALDRNTGKLIWKSKGNGEKSAYCSPLIIERSNRHILITMTEKSILGLDVETGEMLWKHEQTNRWSVHANTPLYHDGFLYCVSGYGKGGVMLKVSENGTGVTEVWRNATLDNKMGGVILHDGRLYGSGDANRKWFCIEWRNGKELFSSKMMAKGNVIMADGMLYCYAQSGDIGLVEPKADSFNLVSAFRVPYGTNQHWAHTVIHNKRLYVRHGNSLMVYSLSAR